MSLSRQNPRELSSAELKRIASFFFMVSLEEKVVQKGLNDCSHRLLRDKLFTTSAHSEVREERFIRALFASWKRSHTPWHRSVKSPFKSQSFGSVSSQTSSSTFFGQGGFFILPSNLPLKEWQIYLQKAWEEESVVLVLVTILGFSIESTARALGLSQGSLITRHQNGLLHFAQILLDQKNSGGGNL